MNDFKVKLFDELVISEYDLALIIQNYNFPKEHYAKMLKELGHENLAENKEFFNLVIKEKDKIKFRTKNIIFIGYDKNESNK